MCRRCRPVRAACAHGLAGIERVLPVTSTSSRAGKEAFFSRDCALAPRETRIGAGLPSAAASGAGSGSSMTVITDSEFHVTMAL